MNTYNTNIAQALQKHLADYDFFFSFDATKGVFMFPLGMDGKVNTLLYHIIVNEHGFTTIAHFPLAPSPCDAKTMYSMTHFSNFANDVLPNAVFAIDPDDGEINAKFYCCCRGLEAPTDGMIAESIKIPCLLFEKYQEGILQILFGHRSAKEAFEFCEGSNVPLQEVEPERRCTTFSLGAFLHRKNADEDSSAEDAEYTSVNDI